MEKLRKIAVVLSGCGVFDGSEIHEAIMALYAIARHKAVYEIFAPDINQHHVIDHLSGQESHESRNVLVESARIARGNVKPLDQFDADQYDGLFFPGGYGAAKNLCDFASNGSHCNVNKQVAEAIKRMVQLGKPIGACCIAPVIIARVLGDIKVTIGDDGSTAKAIEEMGAVHVNTTHGEIVVDEEKKIVTTPCYMLDASIVQVAEGIDKAIKQMLQIMQ